MVARCFWPFRPTESPCQDLTFRTRPALQLQAVPAGEKPSLDVVVAMFDVLMKHNDRLAVQSSMGVCVELGIELNDSYQAKLAEFLEKAQVQAYHEGGDW